MLESALDLVRLAVAAVVAHDMEDARKRCEEAHKDLRKTEFGCRSESCAFHTMELYRLKKKLDALKTQASKLPTERAALLAPLFAELDDRIAQVRQLRS